MENGFAITFFFIFFGHALTNAWLNGTAFYLSTQLFCFLTAISWALAFGQEGGLGVLFVFAMFSLIINIKYITDTPFLDLQYMHLGRFKEFCMEKGHLNGLEALTIYGFYALAGALWLIAIADILAKWL